MPEDTIRHSYLTPQVRKNKKRETEAKRKEKENQKKEEEKPNLNDMSFQPGYALGNTRRGCGRRGCGGRDGRKDGDRSGGDEEGVVVTVMSQDISTTDSSSSFLSKVKNFQL
jgi:hypothetical protein